MIINSVLFSLYFFFDTLFFFLFIYSCKMAYIFPKVINVSNKQVVLSAVLPNAVTIKKKTTESFV